MRISDWSSDVCSSDLGAAAVRQGARPPRQSDDGQGQGHGGALVQGRHARTSYDSSFKTVRKIHHTASRHSTRKQRIAATLITTFSSDTPYMHPRDRNSTGSNFSPDTETRMPNTACTK